MTNIIRLTTRMAAGHRDATDPLAQATESAAVNSSVLQSYCQSIQRQADFDLSGFSDEQLENLPDVNANLNTARESARKFLDDTNPMMWSAVSDISAYGTLVMATLDEIEDQELLDRFLSDPDAQATFVTLMAALRTNSMQRQTQALEVRTVLEQQRDLFNADAATLGSDGTTFNAVLMGSEEAAELLMCDLADLQDSIDGLIAGVVISALVTAGGIVLIVVGLLASVPSGGSSSSLIATGVAATVGGGVGLGVTSAALRDANEARRDLLIQQAQLAGEVVLLMDLSATVTGLANCAANAADTVQAMANAWTNIANNLGEIVDLAGEAETEGDVDLLRVYVRALRRQWEDLRDIALQLQTDFQSLDTRPIDDIANVPVEEAA